MSQKRASNVPVAERTPLVGVGPSGPPAPWPMLGLRPFTFEHTVAASSLLDLERLARLAQDDRIERLAERNDWVKISFANTLAPEYAALHDELVADIERRSGVSIRRTMTWSGMTIFLSSPRLAVPYHFDHDVNFLYQIAGTKTVELFDQTDRSILTEAEIEAFYRGNALAGRFREELAQRATTFELRPGLAVHHPPLAPHRMVNGDDVSISVSLFYTTHEADERAYVYQANSVMRQWSLAPEPPGRSPRRDRLKARVIKAFAKRAPQTHEEMLFSAIRRVDLPARALRKIGRRLRGEPAA